MKDAIAGHAQITGFFLILLCLVVFASAVQARDVTFSWTANTEPVNSYQLYYKTGTIGGSPYNGTGASEGKSPVNTGNVTTFTLHGLSDSVAYHFVLTAVAGTIESNYSTEVTLNALPDQSGPGITATFSWLPNEEANLAGYKIHYGTTSGSYGTTIDVGNPTPVEGRIQAQVVGLNEGITYYVAATAYDASGLESDYSTEVALTATSQSGAGSPPVASAGNISTPEDQAVSDTVTAGNDTGLLISYQIQRDVTNGNLLLETGSGHFTYTPRKNFAGTDSFTFLARDDNGNSNVATVSITVSATNDPPTAINAALTSSEDSAAKGQLQAQDPDSDSLTYAAVSNPTRGTLTLKTAGAFTYTPAANATGTDSFTFQVSDGQATSNTATVNITITATNDVPTAENVAITVNEDSTTKGQLQAQDPDGDSLTYSVVANPSRGILGFKSSGAFTYTPAANATGTDNFTFQVSDGQATSNTATVNITITAINDPPTAKNVAITVNHDSTANGQLQAQDPEDDSLTYSIVARPEKGALTLKSSGAFTYTPATMATGTDNFTFKASDGQTPSNTATVSITIQPAPDVTGIFSWMSNENDDVAGYKIHYGTTSNTYVTTIDVGNPTSIDGRIQGQVDGLTEGTTYYFAITAYNTSGQESDYSTEIVWLATSPEKNITPPINNVGGDTVVIFGDTSDSTHAGTLTETFTNINNDINASAEQIRTWSWSSSTPHKPANTIIIKADLSTLQKTIKITEAKLYLYLTSAVGEAAYNNSIHKIIGKNPVIDQVTGNNAYNGEQWTPVSSGTTSGDIPLGLADIGQAEDTITIGTQSGYQIWTITDMVQNWINDPADNFGLLITGVPTNTETGRTFAASKNQNGSFRPKLVIRYIKKPPKPSIISARKIR